MGRDLRRLFNRILRDRGGPERGGQALTPVWTLVCAGVALKTGDVGASAAIGVVWLIGGAILG